MILDFVPTSLTFDEDAWILKSATQVSGVTGGSHPGSFTLHAAYPNPFNGEVNIPYTTGANFDGTLAIYDIRGREVFSVLLHHDAPADYDVHWDGKDQRGVSLGSGIYIAQISSVELGTFSQKLSILK